MEKLILISGFMTCALACAAFARGSFEQDTIRTGGGDLVITFIGHGTLMFGFGDTVVHVDPVSREADYSKLPKADLVLVTHGHGDHLDPDAIAVITKDGAVVAAARTCAEKLDGAVVMDNGDSKTLAGLAISAVPAYNIEHTRENGRPFHPKGEGNGYVIDFGGTRVYVAGDTENIPEMKDLEDIDIAFLPMNLPYTMTPAMVADAAGMFRPDILYPYHYGDTDTSELVKLLEDGDIEVRIRDLR